MKSVLTIFCFLFVASLPVFAANPDPGVGEYTISIPSNVQAHLVSETLDNRVVYKFKKSDGSAQFLFSINKLDYDQWAKVLEQIPNATLLTAKGNFIFYIETTSVSGLKGADKDAYAETIANLDTIKKSIVVN